MSIEGHLLDISVAILIFFIVSCLLKGKLLTLQKLYILSAGCLTVWLFSVGLMDVAPDWALWILDALTCSASAMLVMTILVISIIFSKNLHKVPRKVWLLYIPPIITSIVVFTNPLHHLFYQNFSIYASQVKFGPLFMLSGSQYYIGSLLAIGIILHYAFSSRNKRVFAQAAFFIGGLIVPLVVNIMVTLKLMDLSIAATPLAFLVTICCHGIAVYYLNFLNIKPLALQNMVDNISEGYMILSSDSCIIYSNAVFDSVFGEEYGMRINEYLRTIVENLEERKKQVIYNLLNFFDVCKQSVNIISYEQAVLDEEGKRYYSVELTPVLQKYSMIGVIAMFRDVTELKEEIKRKQQNLSRAMERERLISLGQMIGSISHNLKTPIMAVSGDVKALRRLTEEYEQSIGDPDVTEEDYAEICQEMQEWLLKIDECCFYMSDIITTVKGMAANLSTSSEQEFLISDVLERVQMFLKSKLSKNSCRLQILNELEEEVEIQGDANNLIQVLNNLVDNACDAMADHGGDILLRVYWENKKLRLSVRDSGPGVSEEVKKQLFRTMCTTKGIKGTGLGLYSSEEVIRGKFGGKLWFQNEAEGGATFYVEIPIDSEEM